MSSHRSQAFAAEACKRRDEKSIQILRTRRAASAAALFDFPPSSSSSSSSSSQTALPTAHSNLYVTVEEDAVLAAGPVYPPVPTRPFATSPPSSSGSSTTVGPSPKRPSGPTRSRPSNRRIPLHTQSSYLSVTSNRSMSIAGLSECNRESISTVWSSADIPVFLDSKRMPEWDSSANVFMRTPRDEGGVPLPDLHTPRANQDHSDKEELQEVMSRSSTEGPRTVSSPLSSDGLDESPSRAFSKKQRSVSSRPPPLIFAPVTSSRDNLSNHLPHSISDSSHLNMSTVSQPAMPFRQTNRQRTPPDLYSEADKYFSKSYTMTPPLTTNCLPKTCSPLLGNLPELAPHVMAPLPPNRLQSRFSDNGTEDGAGLVVSPSFSISRDSRSSAESSTLPDIDDSIAARLSPTSTNFSVASSTKKGANKKATSEFTEQQSKYDFLNSSAVLARNKSPSVTSCQSRAASIYTKASADGAVFEIVHATPDKAAISSVQATPPRRSSLRARAKTVGAVDRPETIERSNGGSRRPSRSGIEVPTERYRRPSSTDDLPASMQEPRKLSQVGMMNGSDCRLNASFTSLQSLNEVSKSGRVPSTTSSSNFQGDATSQRGSVTKKASSNSMASRPKSKGANWASHLGQGLTMHIEQGAKKHVIKLNYLSYDPFGKAESLCLERPNTPGRPRSKSGPVDNEIPESIGLLEFAPSADSLATTHLIFQDTPNDAPVLKHLVVGDDFKADLISRQAVLAIGSLGTREVSGSERKGKNTWRFVYGVEECRFESGQACDGIKTLRPLSFFCSATLLDPSRAKKTRMLNMIRKQMGTRIESMPMSGQSSPSSSLPASKAASPQSRTARLDTPGSLASLSLSRGNSSVSSSVSTQTTLVSPQGRPDLIPFKMTRPMLDAMKSRNASASTTATGPIVISAPMMADGNPLLSKPGRLLPSALTSAPLAAEVRSGSDASNAKSRRPADLPSSSPERPRRERATTTQQSVISSRPTTASEEIKQAYLLRRAATEAETFESLAAATRASFFPRNRLLAPMHPHPHLQVHQQQQQSQYYQRRQPQYPQRGTFECENILEYPSSTIKAQINARRPSTSQVDTRASSTAKFTPNQQPISPLSLRKQRPNQAVVLSTATTTTYDAPEGPYWL